MFSCIALSPPLRAPQVGVSQDYVGSMLLSQLNLPSRSYHAIGGIAWGSEVGLGPSISEVEIQDFREGGVREGALHKFIANCAPNLRKIVGI